MYIFSLSRWPRHYRTLTSCRHDSYTDTQPLHVAIIMDGNGRWATQRAMPRVAGHCVGVEVVRKVVEHAPSLGINTLTLYAFSSDNWRRPAAEVSTLDAALSLATRERGAAAAREQRSSHRHWPPRSSAARARRCARRGRGADRDGTTLHMRLAIDYSARDEILRAAQRLARA